jgi:azurin
MKANISTLAAALLLAVILAGCGGDQDSSDTADGSDRATSVADRIEPEWDVATTGEDSAEEVAEGAEAGGDAAEGAGDRVAEMGEDVADGASEMAGDAANQTQEMAEAAGNETEEMAEEAGEQAAEMAAEVGGEAEEAVADAADTMSTEDDSEAGGNAGDPCVVDVGVGDSLAYDVDGISVPSSCESVTINLAHTGSLPAEAMGHNWVLAPADSLDAIGQAGMSAGPENDYVPDDDRIVAATDVIGGGESTSVTFSLDELEDGVDYAYVCTFPGHWSVMRGPFTVE